MYRGVTMDRLRVKSDFLSLCPPSLLGVRVSTGQNVTPDQGIIYNSCDITDEQSKATTGVTKPGSNNTEESLAMSKTRKRDQISHQQIEITKKKLACSRVIVYVGRPWVP